VSPKTQTEFQRLRSGHTERRKSEVPATQSLTSDYNLKGESAMNRTLLALIVAVALAASAFAHNGITNFIPTLPNPMDHVIDGLDDDWGWYDSGEFAIIEMSAETYGGGRVVSDTDMNFLYLHAWSPPPDNAYYVFARVNDDTLRIQEGDNPDSWWNDDNLKQGFDMDHGGGNWVNNDEEGISWQQSTAMGYHFSFNPVFTEVSGIHSRPRAGDLEVLGIDTGYASWQTFPPYCYAKATILPATAENFTPNVEQNYEYVCRTFSELNLGDLPSSIMHVWEEDQVVHINIGFEDGDWGPHGEDQIWHQPGATFETNNFETGTDNWAVLTTDGVVEDSFIGRDADCAGFAGCSPTGGGETSVENMTWARIKSQLSN
jgi:hypothetical protein